tara:strand:- start:719 stop:1567 length:849 start_codon:yes stop_codon:yes gene_type:complete
MKTKEFKRLDIKENIGFIGAGNIASALIQGLLKNGSDRKKIYASSPEQDHLDSLKKLHSVNVTKSNEEVILSCSTIILAVKPSVVRPVLEGNKNILSVNDHLVISVAAGVSINFIESLTNTDHRIVRVMPNTPVSIGMGVSALSCNSSAGGKDKIKAEKIFSSVGEIYWMKERSLDLYTSLIGSGPAYIFYFIEALQKAAVGLDLDEESIKNLITEMIIGSASLAKISKEDPKTLREKVTSPGGVTEKAIKFLNSNKVADVLIQAVKEGENRSIELGEKEDV